MIKSSRKPLNYTCRTHQCYALLNSAGANKIKNKSMYLRSNLLINLYQQYQTRQQLFYNRKKVKVQYFACHGDVRRKGNIQVKDKYYLKKNIVLGYTWCSVMSDRSEAMLLVAFGRAPPRCRPLSEDPPPPLTPSLRSHLSSILVIWNASWNTVCVIWIHITFTSFKWFLFQSLLFQFNGNRGILALTYEEKKNSSLLSCCRKLCLGGSRIL